ncbi:bola-like protein [Xylaria venustula]|nr:bola-like protein [Xylaria venustula]
MLSSRYCRIAASALQHTSRAARSSPTKRALTHVQARNIISTRSSRSPREIQSPRALRYSTTATSSPDAARPEKPDYLNDAESAIWDKLTAEFSPTELMVQDISGGCGSMYGIEIASEKFRGANMLKQQRMVNAVLGDEMKSWHGVQLRTRIP